MAWATPHRPVMTWGSMLGITKWSTTASPPESSPAPTEACTGRTSASTSTDSRTGVLLDRSEVRTARHWMKRLSSPLTLP